MSDLVLSLFPGADLLGYAFEREGFCVVKGPDVIFGGDIREFHPTTGRFEGIIGGPPCQPFSALVHLVRANGHEPRHPNLIPEYERVVAEAAPGWFLMEEVPAAPRPKVEGYAVHSFLLDNSTLDSGDGWGNEQIRRRMFSFGIREKVRDPNCAVCEFEVADSLAGCTCTKLKAVDLRRWIDFALQVLPDAVPTLIGSRDGAHGFDNSPEGHAKARQPTVAGHSGVYAMREFERTGTRLSTVTAESHRDGDRPGQRRDRERQLAVTADAREVPVKMLAGEKSKTRVTAVLCDGEGDSSTLKRRGWRKSTVLVGGQASPNGGNRLSVQEACRRQGLPETWADELPFTMHGKRMVIGNGVPIPMGRQLAAAIRKAGV